MIWEDDEEDFGEPGSPMRIEGPNGKVIVTLDGVEADFLRMKAAAEGVTPIQYLLNSADAELAIFKAIGPHVSRAVDTLMSEALKKVKNR